MSVTVQTTPSRSLPSLRRAPATWRWLPPVAGTVFFALLWELLSATHVLPPEVPALSAVIGQLWTMLGGTTFWSAAGTTMLTWFLGLGIALVLGTALGIAIGASDVVRELLYVPVEFLRPLPPLVYLPLAILVLSASTKTAVVLVVSAAVWPVLLQTSYGIRDADPILRDTARAYRLKRSERIRFVTLPGAGPFVATGLRISATMALIVTVGVELLGTGGGFGGDMYRAEQIGDYKTMFAYALAAGLVGMTMNALFMRIEQSVFSWAPAYRPKEPR